MTAYVDRRLEGTSAEVAAQIRAGRADGSLLSMSVPRQVAGTNRVTLVARYRLRGDEHRPAPAPARPLRRSRVRWAVAVPVGVGVVAGVGYAVWQAAQAVVAALPTILGALVLLAVVWVWAKVKSRRDCEITVTHKRR